MAMGILGTVAAYLNAITLDPVQWLTLLGLILVGQIPIMLLAGVLANVKRQETLGMLMNLVTFPLVIVSGLWWPLETMPEWVQNIGRHLPTYFLNRTIGQVINHAKINWSSVVGISEWILIMTLVTAGVAQLFTKRSSAINA